jgi:hypothetical protein
MIKDSFEITQIPETSDVVNKIVEKNVEIIIFNYVCLIRDLIDITMYTLNKDIVKPLIFYNTCFLVELSLKYYLIRSTKLNINDVEEKGHNIVELMRSAKEIGLDVDELQFLLQKFRNRENHRLDLNNYYNYKYNREIGQDKLIFDFECSDKEKNNIKEVMEWIKRYI